MLKKRRAINIIYNKIIGQMFLIHEAYSSLKQY